MRKVTRIILLCFTIPLLSSAAPGQSSPPATRPANFRLGAGPLVIVQRARNSLGELTLTEDEKTQIKLILDRANTAAQDLAGQLQDADPQQRIQQITPFLADLRQQLASVLTPEQYQSLAEKMPGLANAGSPPGEPFQLMVEGLRKLNLTADQKQKTSDLISQGRQQIQQLRQKQQDGQATGPQVQQIREELRGKLQEILSPKQFQDLRTFIENAAPPIANPNRPAAQDGSKSVKPDDSDSESTRKTPAPGEGSPAPDIHINELNGRPQRLSSFQGHVLVIEFGSLSAPTFRDHAAAMEKLKGEVGSQATFLILYTREAYPAGGWDIQRNKDQGISIAQPKDFAARSAMAAQARRLLHITIPMAVDSMEDEAATAFDGMPNGAVVLDKKGVIVAHQQWTTIDGLRSAIEQANQK